MKEEENRRAISRAAVLLAASKSDNVKNQAFRLLLQKFQFNPRHDELEIALAELQVDAMRALSQLFPERGA
jgi:hypothetical protein